MSGMMRIKRCATVFFTSILLIFISQSLHAQGNDGNAPGKSFGKGQPANVLDLPAGQLRRDIENLPVQAREKAMNRLRKFSFPEEDLGSIRVSFEGSIWYEDNFEAAAADVKPAAGPPDNAALTESAIFSLHSLPGSSNVIFLDFDGAHVKNTDWNTTGRALNPLPFDPSENDDPPTEANFTQDELNRIFEIWHRISEDYAPFDLDITTEEPAVFTSTTGHVVFTHFRDANNRLMPGYSAGGIGFIDVFGTADYVSKTSPAFVYYTNLSVGANGEPTYNAEVGSHEIGHNLGLSHDGTGGSSYYNGHGTGLVSWAPIMGRGQDSNVTTWSKGDYPGANNFQDDVAIVAAKLGYTGDDHGNSAALATAITVEANGDILVSSPELDPGNELPENKGIIDDRFDVDWFYIDVADDSTLTISATPAWHSFTRSSNRGANLDIELALFDASMGLLAVADATNDTGATVISPLSAGRYFLQVDGVGNHTFSDYSDYSSMGMFFLEGSLQSGSPDTTPPAPGVMAWQAAPQAMSETSISMTAVEATDDSGSVEYYFTCVAGGAGCGDSGWQSGRSHTASGLIPDTYYSYKVKARDSSRNQNSHSATMGDTTDEPPPPPENEAPVAAASYSPSPAVITKGKTMNVTLNGAASSDSDGSIVAWSWQNASGSNVSQNSITIVKLRAGEHAFTLTVTDNDGATASTQLTVVVTKARRK